MAADEKWYFTKAQLANTPSRRCGLDADKELSYRQQAANFIQDMGQRLKVTQLCINTAIVYMHRFYIFHSFTQFHRNSMASASLFLAAKVEEQPRKLEHVITVAHWCLFREEPKLDTKSEQYLEQAQELVFNENVLLQTLGFDVAIDHPHTHVVRCCHLVRANKELAQTSYFMASNSLHLTTMCLQYKPTVVACFCIHLACKWSNWEIPQSSEGKDWFTYVDPAVSLESLEQLTSEFLLIFDKCPSRLKKMSGKKDDSYGLLGHNLTGPQMEQEPRRVRPTLPSGRPGIPGQSQDGATTSSSMMPQARQIVPDESKKVDYRDYKEKRAREAAAAAVAGSGGTSKDGKPPPPHPQQNRQPPPHHHLAKREAAKREMMAKESAKREAMKQEASRSREGSTQRPVEVPNLHHLSQESRDQKRPRDVPDSAAGSSQQLSDSSAASLLQQKRPESHHLPLESRRSREPSDIPPTSSHHHHHPDQTRSQRPRELLDPSPSNHHNHPSMHSSNQMKRPREDLGSLTQSVSQPKRPRDGADLMVNNLDSTKRPREPPDLNSPFSLIKSEPNVQSGSSNNSQHSDRHHLSGQGTKYPQDSKSQQLPSLSAFSDGRQSKPTMPPSANTSSQRHMNHNRHARPQEGNTKSYDQQERSKRDSPGLPKIQQDVHSLRPSHVGKSPIPPLSRSKSPSEPPKLTDSRSRSPFMAASNSQEPEKKPEVSKRMAAVIMSRPRGHLFSPPNDDHDDMSLPSLDVSLPELISNKFENKSQRPSPSIKPKLRTSPEKSRESLLAPPMFTSPTSPAMPGKSGLPTTPTNSDSRKRRRTQSSSSSEPELVPVVRKLEDVPGYHSLLKDGGIKLTGRVPDMIQPIRDHNLPSTPGKETPSPSNIKQDQHANDIKSLMLQPIMSESEDRSFSGFSSLMEMSHQGNIKVEVAEPVPVPSLFDPPALSPDPGRLSEPQRVEEVSGGGEHHRKKKKEKHGKKDKDRNREEKKHKHKKNKDRDKAREEKNLEQQAGGSSAPIRLTIAKDKLTSLSEENKKSPSLSHDSTSGLKIKIPKERLKVESSQMPSSSSTASSVSLGGLKIKIGKEVMSDRRLESSPSDHVSRKQQRSNDANAAAAAAAAASRQPQSNTARRNYNKQNGHPDRKVLLKVDSGSLQPSPGCRQ